MCMDSRWPERLSDTPNLPDLPDLPDLSDTPNLPDTLDLPDLLDTSWQSKQFLFVVFLFKAIKLIKIRPG